MLRLRLRTLRSHVSLTHTGSFDSCSRVKAPNHMTKAPWFQWQGFSPEQRPLTLYVLSQSLIPECQVSVEGVKAGRYIHKAVSLHV